MTNYRQLLLLYISYEQSDLYMFVKDFCCNQGEDNDISNIAIVLHSYHDNSNYYFSWHIIFMVIYGLLGVAALVNCSLTPAAITGVQYVRLDLMMMLEMLHVHN